MKPFLLLILSLSFAATPMAQDSLGFTNKAEGYRTWTKYHANIRFGVGIQKSFYSELGLSFQRFYYNEEGFASMAYYTSFEFIPTFSTGNNVEYGVRIGAEMNLMVLAIGLETSYCSDLHSKDIVITPKIGYGLGILNLFFGYNISTMGNPFSNIGNYQFSIAATINKRMYSKLFSRKPK